MAKYGKVEQITRVAAADLSLYRWHVAAVGGSRTAALSTVAATTIGGGAPFGVFQEVADAAGKAVSVGVAGVSKVIAGAAIDEGKLLTCNGSGRAIAAGSGDVTFGQALEAAAADGDLIQCYLQRPHRLVGAN